MGLNGLLDFKGPTHLMPIQTHPFETPNPILGRDIPWCVVSHVFVSMSQLGFLILSVQPVNVLSQVVGKFCIQ